MKLAELDLLEQEVKDRGYRAARAIPFGAAFRAREVLTLRRKERADRWRVAGLTP